MKSKMACSWLLMASLASLLHNSCKSCQFVKLKKSSLENIPYMNYQKELAHLDIRVVKWVQPLEALIVNLEVQHLECLDDLAFIWKPDITTSKCWNGTKEQSHVRLGKVWSKPFISYLLLATLTMINLFRETLLKSIETLFLYLQYIC